jgi:hypothetical protein
MKQVHLIPAFLLISAMISGCFVDEIFDCERGQGNVIREFMDVDGFDGVRLEVAANVYIQQGDMFSVEVEGERNIIDLIEKDVRGGNWDIEFRRCVRDYNKLQFYITMPEIRTLSVSGSGSITGENVFQVTNIDLAISGSGMMDIELTGNSIDGSISGSGEMRLAGTIDDLDFRISGSGDLKAYNLAVRKADIEISGSGDAEVSVSDYLKVRISGSGDVFYRGNPDVDARVSGSGKVINAN